MKRNVSIIVNILCAIIWICSRASECCRFGSEPNCGFPCRCTGTNQCNPETGKCQPGSQCKNVPPTGNGWKGPGCRIGNVAYKKTASQSGAYLHYSADLAVDGRTYPYINNWLNDTCAHPQTQSELLAWWEIDLGATYRILNITIINRAHNTNPAKFQGRTGYFYLRIGNDTNPQHECLYQEKHIGAQATLFCHDSYAVGRYIRFQRTAEGIDPNEANFCEFIVTGYETIDCNQDDCIGNCDALIGCEQCVAGKKLPDCNNACPSGYWGTNCANRCGMCKDDVVCDNVTGSCGEQCDMWYIPDMCTEPLVPPPITSNVMLRNITSNSAELSWNRSEGFDTSIQDYFYHIVEYNKNFSDPAKSVKSERINLSSAKKSYQYNLLELSYNTAYEVEIVPYRELNGRTEPGIVETSEFKTLCIAPDTPPAPSISGTPDMFTITWEPITSIESHCDEIKTLKIIITCENSTHTILDETENIPITNTSFVYGAENSTQCEVALVVTNNEDYSAKSEAVPILTSTTYRPTEPSTLKTSTKSITSTKDGVLATKMTDPPPSNIALIAGAAAGGVVIIAIIIIIVVIMLRRRNNKPKAKKDEEPSYDEVTTTSQTLTFNNNLIAEKQNKHKPEQKLSGIQYHNVDDKAMGGEYEVVGNITSSENGAVPSKASSEETLPSEPPRPERLPPKPKPQQKPKPQVAPKVEPTFKLEDTETKVLLTRLENYITKKKEGRGAFKKEYDALPTDHKHPCNTGIAKGNVEKNRFKNIVAYDHSRVILDIIDDEPLSDYVNANYLPGHTGDETYIASQGPKPEHVKDFWRMIWLKDINRIVMVTNEVEGNKKKCDRYWPLHVDNKLEHGDITILSLATEVYADFTIRVMKLTKQNETRQVRQFHFTSWHDKRIPDYAFPLLIFRHKIRSYDASARGPMLVHCSAGIGRTGTFIAIDYLMDQARKYDAIDVFSYVNKMRANRVNMIQTLEQYIFVYDTILESQMVGETAIPCSEMDARYPELIETGEYQNISQLEKEYKELQKFHPEPEGKQFSALSSANSDKNRNKNIYPSDVTRPFLVKHPGEDSDYINAVYIDGYTKNKAFIVTQLPLENTVIDFWRMITDHNSTTVIVLEPQTVPFIPTKVKSPEQHGNVEVTLLSEKTIKSVKIQDLSVRTPYGTGEPMLVTIYHTLSWTDKDFPKLNEILQLLQLLEKRQRDMHESPCTIQCLNGVSRSGVLISILYAIDRMRVDQEIDIFHSVKSVRINRNQFVESLAQYEYIYKSVQSYRAQFDTYANFD